MKMSAMKFAVGFSVCLFVLIVAFYDSNPLAVSLWPPCWGRSSCNAEDDEQMSSLKALLSKAQMDVIEGERTVIFTAVNAAWTEPGSLFDIFLESFNILRNRNQDDLLKHLIVLAFDRKAYNRCIAVHPLCYEVITEDVDFASAKAYMSDDYLKMMWRRIELLTVVLDMGYNFIFSDADIICLRSPFPYLQKDMDLQIATDRFNGDPSSHENAPNGGYMLSRSTERTRKFYRLWYESRLTYPNKHDQDVFVELRHNKSMSDMKMKIAYLDTTIFSCFCSHWLYNMSRSVTMHANCCTGLNNKLRNLHAILQDWKKFTMSGNGERRWSYPEGCPLQPV